jgi:hypothetical protein
VYRAYSFFRKNNGTPLNKITYNPWFKESKAHHRTKLYTIHIVLLRKHLLGAMLKCYRPYQNGLENWTFSAMLIWAWRSDAHESANTSAPVLLPCKFFGRAKHNKGGDLFIHVRKREHDRNFSVGSPSVHPCTGPYGPHYVVPRFCMYLRSRASTEIEKSYKTLPRVTSFFLTRHTHTVSIYTGIHGLDMGFDEPNMRKKANYDPPTLFRGGAPEQPSSVSLEQSSRTGKGEALSFSFLR